MPLEPTIARKWIWDTLTADATIISLVGNRVYTEAGPQSVVYPYILIQTYGEDPDVLGMGANRFLARLEYIVQGVDNLPDESRIEPIAVRIDQLLHDKGNIPITGGGMVLQSRRVRPFTLAQDLDTVQYRRLGGRYYLEIVPA